MNTKKQHRGKILIVGRSNTGKSTLFNKLIKKKISIVSKKKNTTIKNIIGKKISLNSQYIFIDTPGIYSSNAIYLKRKNKNVKNIQLILFVVEKTIWSNYDEKLYEYIKNKTIPIIIIINKIDLCKKKEKLLPYMQFIQKKINPISIFPISAKKNYEFPTLLNKIKTFLPLKSVNKQKEKNPIKKNLNTFMYTEFVRETLFHYLHQEIPYNIKIKIKKYLKLSNKEICIYINIITTSQTYKKIIIGKKGKKIKEISMMSRKKIEIFLKKKIHLMLKVILLEKKKYK